MSIAPDSERAPKHDNSPIKRRGHLVVRNVSKIFGGNSPVQALAEVDLDIRPGEFFSLLGPSGCGKSTLLEVVAGLQTPTTGEVSLDGKIIDSPGPDRTVVFQHYALFPWQTALQNVAFPLKLARLDRKDCIRRASEALETVGLSGFDHHFVSQLSGGMQQRVALARALVCDPSVLLMDEPFSGADAITREVLQVELHELHRRNRNTVLFVTHSVDEALGLSDRVAVLGTQPGRVEKIFDLERERLDAMESRERGAIVAELKEEIWGILSGSVGRLHGRSNG